MFTGKALAHEDHLYFYLKEVCEWRSGRMTGWYVPETTHLTSSISVTWKRMDDANLSY
jgi:hypothetical protein